MAENKTSVTVSFRVGNDLADKIDQRMFEGEPSRGEIARRDLERYYYALDMALSQVASTLSAAEACVVCDANNGTWHETWSATMLWANVYDSPGMDEKWGVDVPALIEKMRKWNYWQSLAVVDAVERFWNDCQNSTVQGVGLTEEKVVASE